MPGLPDFRTQPPAVGYWQASGAGPGTDLGGALHVIGTYNLKMTDFELTPPSLMFGRIKVRDEVTVKFDLVLKS